MGGAAAAADALSVIDGAAPNRDPQRVALLLEHVAAIDTDRIRPSAHERLERVVGSYLARLLVGALVGGRRRGSRV